MRQPGVFLIRSSALPSPFDARGEALRDSDVRGGRARAFRSASRDARVGGRIHASRAAAPGAIRASTADISAAR